MLWVCFCIWHVVEERCWTTNWRMVMCEGQGHVDFDIDYGRLALWMIAPPAVSLSLIFAVEWVAAGFRSVEKR